MRICLTLLFTTATSLFVCAPIRADPSGPGNNHCIEGSIAICQPGSFSMHDLKFTPANSGTNFCTIICLGDSLEACVQMLYK